jgi:hypothetical protein
VQPLFEEDGVAKLRVVASHADAYHQLVPRGDGTEEVPARGPRSLGRSERRRHDRGARVQHGRQVRVVVVERMGQGAVQEGRAGCRKPLAPSYDAGLLLATPAFDHRPYDPGRFHPARSQGYADDVGDPPSGIPQDLGFHVTVPHPGGEPGYFLQYGLHR